MVRLAAPGLFDVYLDGRLVLRSPSDGAPRFFGVTVVLQILVNDGYLESVAGLRQRGGGPLSRVETAGRRPHARGHPRRAIHYSSHVVRALVALPFVLFLAAGPATALERVKATSPRVVPIDPASLTVVPAVETSVKVPPLATSPSGAIREVPAGEPVRARVREARETVTPGENGVPPPLTLRFPASGSVEVGGRKLEAPKVVPALAPRLLAAGAFARRDNMLGDIGYLDVDQGLLTAYPNAMLQDRRGFLWFTTWAGGLSRYDGTSFGHLTLKEGLPSDKPEALLEDRSGAFWIGGAAGLTRYDGATFTQYTTKQGLPHDNVVLIFEDRRGSLWLSTDKGLCRFDGASFTSYGKAQGLVDAAVTGIVERKDGSLWISVAVAEASLFRFDGRSFTRYGVEDGLPADGLTSLAEDDSGALWLTGRRSLSRLQGDEVTTYGPEQGLPGEDTQDLRADPDGSLWIATRRGLVKARRQPLGAPIVGFTHVSEEHGLSHYRTAFTFRDRAGFVWAGTLGGGLSRVRLESFQHVTGKEGLSDSRVWRIVEARDGALWLATDKGVVRRSKDGATFAHLPVVGGTGRDQVHSVYEDRAGRLWIGTAAQGVFRYDGETLTHVVPADGKDFGRVWTFAEDAEGRLFIGSGTGVVRYDGKTFTRYPAELFGGSAAYGVVAGPDGDIWFARRKGGVSVLRGDSLTRLDPEGPLGKAEANVCLFDRAGRLWVATRAGLAVYRDGELTLVGEEDGLSSPLVFSLALDPQGAVWAATEHGLNRVSLPTSGALSVQAFGREEGLRAVDFNQGTGLFDREGRGWWGTGKALSVLPAEASLAPTKAAPSVQLVGLDLRQRAVDYRQLLARKGEGKAGDLAGVELDGVPPFANHPLGLVLPFDVRDLAFRFSAVDWRDAHLLEYQSMLAGEGEEEWSPPTRESRAVFQNIPPGAHVFRARARLGRGDWGPPVELPFRVLPPWWATVWAKGLWLLLAAGFVGGLVKWRVRALEARRAELERLVEERTAEIAEQKARLEVSEREAQAAREQAVQASHAKSLFLANMSHELRTPLNAVLGFAQLLDRDGSLSGRHHEELGIIQRSGEHLLGLINDVLSLSKIEAGSFTRSDRPFDLHEMLASVQAIVRVRAEARDLDLVFDVDASMPRHVSADEGKLRQVLINLLGNAVKFTERGSVTLRARWAEARARFEVEDTGPGIAEEELGRLFRAFSQTETGLSAKEGTGLGLVISRQIVRLMGGDIDVRSRPGAGTVFSFDVELPASAAPARARQRRKVVSLAPDQERLRVLVVDDTMENRLLLSRLLGGIGLDVREATDGAQALAEWEGWRPHAVFMDMRMPVVDGREATRRIRAREAEGQVAPRTVIVALTASALDHERAELAQSGADGVLAKPFAVDELFATLAQHTGIRYRYEDEAPAALPSSLPGVDVPAGLRRASGSVALYRELLLQAASGLDGAVAGLRGLLERGERKEAAHELHTLKGTAGTLGMRRVAEEAARLETALARQPQALPDLAALAVAVDQVREACEPLRAQVAVPHLAEASSGAPSADQTRGAVPILARLRRHIEESSLDASDDLEELSAALGGQPSEALKRLGSLLERLDFPAALAALEEIEEASRSGAA